MSKRVIQSAKIVVALILISLQINSFRVFAASANVSISIPSQVTVGVPFNVTVSYSGTENTLWEVKVTSTAGDNRFYEDYNGYEGKRSGSKTFQTTINSPGKYTFSVTTAGSMGYDSEEYLTATASAQITVVEKSSSGSDNTGGGNTGTYNPEMPKGETEAEKKARELAERQKKPLIENISIISESTRLKGETLLEDKPSENKFDYAFELPRGVDAFKLDLVPIADDVVLEYTQMYKLDAGHDKVEIVVRASQDEVEQEFKITVKKAPESKAVYTVGQGSYRFLNDELLDKVISKYGFEVVYFDEDVDKTDYYYQYGENKLVLVYGDNGEGKWLLIDGNRNVLNEVLIVVDGEDKVTLLVDKVLEEDDKRTYGGRRYGPIVVPVDNDFYNLDYGLNFATDIKGWEHDLDSYFTHAIDLNGDEKLVYLDKQGHTEVAYVAFDNQGVSLDGMVMPVIAGVSGISSIGLLIYSRKQSKKISNLLSRRSQD